MRSVYLSKNNSYSHLILFKAYDEKNSSKLVLFISLPPKGEPMRIIYRMRGLLGDATEEFIESLDSTTGQILGCYSVLTSYIHPHIMFYSLPLSSEHIYLLLCCVEIY